MALLSRYLAPAGAPIAATDVARWLPASLGGTAPAAALEQALSARFGARHYAFTSTGRAGMTVLLTALRRLAPSSRDEVVLPTYTCYSVAASAARAGLKVRLVDIDPATLDFRPDLLAAIDYRRVLAVVATNLYGLPGNLPALSALAAAQGVFLIDDAAQAMGASVGGRASGTWGDAGLFSFDKGKNVCAIDGGVVTTAAAPIAAALHDEAAALTRPGWPATAQHLVKALGYALLLRPSLYGLVTRVPQLELGKTVFTTEFPLGAPDPLLTSLAATMMPRLDAFTTARRANAAELMRVLAAIPTVTPVSAIAGAEPVYLRLPVLCASEADKHAAIAALNAAGIGASGSYPASLADVPEVQRLLAPGPVAADGGRDVARRIVTLPTHPYVTPADIGRTRDLLAALPARRPAPAAGASARPGEDD